MIYEVMEYATVSRSFRVEAESEDEAWDKHAAGQSEKLYDDGNFYPSDWMLDCIEEIEE